ncbi:hypothetical protein C7W93_13755 [Glaciimonas sp. PCH181]|nr:hypothetical protein C7W93_13755 [Glaciimonas sp. PCH181]
MLPALANAPLLLRQVSAELFWTKSKILDKRQELVAIILGLEECPFPLMPVQLQVFLPKQGYDSVLFIENQTTFEQAIREADGRFSGLAIIFAAGFKGSAKRLRLRSGSSLYFSVEGDLSSAATGKFAAWLYKDGGDNNLSSWFWGDLDYAGMGILQTLKNSFIALEAWQPGYAPMLEALRNGGGHSPENIQKKVERTGCQYADNILIPALHTISKFVDQEIA